MQNAQGESLNFSCVCQYWHPLEHFLSFLGKYCIKLKDAALVFSQLQLSDKGP